MRMWRMERDDLLAKGKITRTEEKARLKRIKDCTKRGVQVPDEDATSIVDPEVEWKASNSIWLAEEARKAKAKSKHQISVNQHEDEEEDVDFIIDTIGDSKLRDAVLANDAFVAVEETDSDEDVQRHLGAVGRPVIDTNTEIMAWILL